MTTSRSSTLPLVWVTNARPVPACSRRAAGDRVAGRVQDRAARAIGDDDADDLLPTFLRAEDHDERGVAPEGGQKDPHDASALGRLRGTGVRVRRLEAGDVLPAGGGCVCAR